MSDHSHIQWTDATWNPITGCSVVSPGCTNCYAMKLAGGRLRNHPSRAGLTDPSRAGPVWNGQVRFNREWLDQPLRWKRPRRIFVCAHSDLFHEGVPFELINKVFYVMGITQRHTYQILTKRPERMREYFRYLHATDVDVIGEAGAGIWPQWTVYREGGRGGGYDCCGPNPYAPSGLDNVWLGVSAEDQQRANERIPLLLDTPAAVRFVSAEPLLGPIDFTELRGSSMPWHPPGPQECLSLDALRGSVQHIQQGRSAHNESCATLDWCIVGGESGPGARPCDMEWVRDIVRQCLAVGTAVFVKQLGVSRRLRDRKGGDITEFPAELRVREMPA